MIGGKPIATAVATGGKKPVAVAVSDDNDDPIASSLALRLKAGGITEVVPNASETKKSSGAKATATPALNKDSSTKVASVAAPKEESKRP
jgi:hypothetical protein